MGHSAPSWTYWANAPIPAPCWGRAAKGGWGGVEEMDWDRQVIPWLACMTQKCCLVTFSLPDDSSSGSGDGVVKLVWESRKRQRTVGMRQPLGPLGLLVFAVVCLWCRTSGLKYLSFGCYTITPNPIIPSVTHTPRIPPDYPILNFVSCFYFFASHCLILGNLIFYQFINQPISKKQLLSTYCIQSSVSVPVAKTNICPPGSYRQTEKIIFDYPGKKWA